MGFCLMTYIYTNQFYQTQITIIGRYNEDAFVRTNKYIGVSREAMMGMFNIR